jgi:alginate O-acetyltransferase complex protein AlgJ
MRRFSGIFFVAFLVVAGITGLLHIRQLDPPTIPGLTRGEWSVKVEKRLSDILPINTASRGLWGKAEYSAFHEGRKGVVVGRDGWLFTDEEFSCPEHAAENLADNFAFIEKARAALIDKGVKVAVVLVPAKARVYSQHLEAALPQCRKNVYAYTQAFLKANGIPATDLAEVMHGEDLYLRTDTHWSPRGAKLAALTARDTVEARWPELKLPVMRFSSQAGPEKDHAGDLMRYLPGVSAVAPDRILSFTTEGPPTASAASLLGDDALSVPQAVLVGTSYSANVNWNFAGFLKEALQADVLNMADEGLGPMAVMDRYLASDAFKNTPPKLLVWEMPERFLLMPHGVSGEK